MLNLIIKPIVRKIQTRSAIMELDRMTDHQLDDLGITRSEIRKFVK